MGTESIPLFSDERGMNGYGCCFRKHTNAAYVAERRPGNGRLFNRYIRGLALCLAFAGCAFVWVQVYGFLGGHL